MSRWTWRVICVCLATVLMMVFGVASAYAWRYIDATGEWVYDLRDGNATIWWRAKEPSGDLVIPNELDEHVVTSIREFAFREHRDLTGITIPDSVTSIGMYPFYRCPLTYINVSPNNPVYEDIDGVLFDKQRQMLISYPGAREGAYSVPGGVLLIGELAFYECHGLTSLTIPDNVSGIGDKAFTACHNLTNVTISNSIEEIGEYAFSFCTRLTSVSLPNNLTSISDGLFFLCKSLTSVSIPDSVTSIGNRAFLECHSLTSISIPNGVTNIDDYTFANCFMLTSVSIPASVTSISPNAFEGCLGLTLSVNVSSYAEEYATDNDIPFIYISDEHWFRN